MVDSSQAVDLYVRSICFQNTPGTRPVLRRPALDRVTRKS
jgi:hypothetical protein